MIHNYCQCKHLAQWKTLQNHRIQIKYQESKNPLPWTNEVWTGIRFWTGVETGNGFWAEAETGNGFWTGAEISWMACGNEELWTGTLDGGWTGTLDGAGWTGNRDGDGAGNLGGG